MNQDIRGGAGIYVNRYGKQHVVSAARSLFRFQPAFAPKWDGESATIGFGTVNGFEPLIDGKPISEGGRLKINSYDAEGRSYIAIKVHVDSKTYKITDQSQVTIINTAATGSRSVQEEASNGDPLIGICPIAVASNTGIHQIVHFNLNHAIGVPPMGPQSPMHFFW